MGLCVVGTTSAPGASSGTRSAVCPRSVRWCDWPRSAPNRSHARVFRFDLITLEGPIGRRRRGGDWSSETRLPRSNFHPRLKSTALSALDLSLRFPGLSAQAIVFLRLRRSHHTKPPLSSRHSDLSLLAVTFLIQLELNHWYAL